MLRDEYMRRLRENAHVELYLSAKDGARIWWPWRMLPPKNATQPYRDACESLIIDSDPSKPSVTTTDVLDCATELGAEVASLSDVYQDKDATVDSLLAGLETADDHPYDGDLLLPLQEPFVECYREIGEPNEMLGIGGLKDATTPRRITAAKNLREYVGDEAWIHGFGWGPADGLGNEIRKQPNLIDSMDYSTPVQNVRYKESAPGEERMSVTAAKSGAALVRNLRELSPLVSVESDNNMTMDEFCKSG
jgi:hypothetical protein